MCCFGAPSHMQAHTQPHTMHGASRNTPEHATGPSEASRKGCGLGTRQRQSPVLTLQPPSLQEMLDIMKSIYDMMGKYTYPAMREEAPREHVENFFQVSRARPGGAELQHGAGGAQNLAQCRRKHATLGMKQGCAGARERKAHPGPAGCLGMAGSGVRRVQALRDTGRGCWALLGAGASLPCPLRCACLQKMDRNKDGVVTIEEFLESCQKVKPPAALLAGWAISLSPGDLCPPIALLAERA